jgi:hypothetical protein
MNILDKDQILAAEDLKTEVVPIPEWGGDVIVSEMSAADSERWLMEAFDDEGKPTRRKAPTVQLAARCIVDESGQRVFSEEDIEALAKKSPKAIGKVFSAAVRLNGLGAMTDEESDEHEKN